MKARGAMEISPERSFIQADDRQSTTVEAGQHDGTSGQRQVLSISTITADGDAPSKLKMTMILAGSKLAA
jgi:hypothetical protein